MISDQALLREGPTARDSLAAAIRSQFLSIADKEQGIPKYLVLKRAILACIRDLALAPGDQLPPENHLTAVLGISIGTVRRAIEGLAASGIVTREQARGTFVAEHRRAVDETWNHRFLSEDGRSLLPVYTRVIDRRWIRTSGAWSCALGDDAAGYVCIQRLFDVDRRFQNYAEFYVGYSRYAAILELPPESLDGANFAQILQERFGTPIVNGERRVRVERMADHVCSLLSLPNGSFGMFIEILSYTHDRVPVSYNSIWVPPTPYFLDMTSQR